MLKIVKAAGEGQRAEEIKETNNCNNCGKDVGDNKKICFRCKGIFCHRCHKAHEQFEYSSAQVRQS